MTGDEILVLFRTCSALLEGHFRLSSGLHSPGYLQCALVLQHPAHAAALGAALADRVRDLRPTVVLSPALGGIVIGHEVARALGVRAIFAEREDGGPHAAAGLQLSPASASRRRGRRDDRRVDARDDAGGAAGGRQVVGGRRRSSIAAAAARRSDVPLHALVAAVAADLRARGLPAVRAGAARRQAGVAADRRDAPA